MTPVVDSDLSLADLYPSAERVDTAAPAGFSMAACLPLLGTVNASAFDGRAAGTLLFLGPESEPGRPTRLAFAYRAEGWQTAPEVGTVQFLDGAPLYRAADFAALRA